jgi:hypothetical protein
MGLGMEAQPIDFQLLRIEGGEGNQLLLNRN